MLLQRLPGIRIEFTTTILLSKRKFWNYTGTLLTQFWSGLTGGTDWSEYDRPEEGCWDWDDDDICDSPFVINGSLNVKDNFPWVLKDGWKNDVNQSLTYLEDYVVHLRMEEEIENSILLKLYHAERVLEQGNYEQAIDHLESLVFQTESLEGKELYEIQAKEIIQLLQYTVDVLNKIDW